MADRVEFYWDKYDDSPVAHRVEGDGVHHAVVHVKPKLNADTIPHVFAAVLEKMDIHLGRNITKEAMRQGIRPNAA